MTAAPSAAPGPDRVLAAAVARTVSDLQWRYLARVPAAAAQLAVLRRAVTQEPGAVPEAWNTTIGILPAQLLGHGDLPSPAERAAHGALTLYALHQQSQPTGMHQEGRTVGDAVRDLRRARHDAVGDVDPVLRRLHALLTAASYTETLYHLRGLITLFRGAGLALDYGRLATDLRRLQHPPAAIRVRLAWARNLYRAGGDTPATSTQASGANA